MPGPSGPLLIRPVKITAALRIIGNGDLGSQLNCEGAVAQTLQLPAVIAKGFICNFTCNNSGGLTINATTNAQTLVFVGVGTGNRTVASPGIGTLIVDVDGTWWVTGLGIT